MPVSEWCKFTQSDLSSLKIVVSGRDAAAAEMKVVSANKNKIEI